MADPFSVIVGTIGVIQVCVHIGEYLQEIKAGAGEIDEEIKALTHEVGALQSVNKSIQRIFELRAAHHLDAPKKDLDSIEDLWRNIGNVLKDCQSTLEKFHSLIIQVEGKDESKSPAMFDRLRRHLRKKSKEGDFLQIRQRLSSYHSALQASLIMLDM
jgi:hypothetical protein